MCFFLWKSHFKMYRSLYRSYCVDSPVALTHQGMNPQDLWRCWRCLAQILNCAEGLLWIRLVCLVHPMSAQSAQCLGRLKALGYLTAVPHAQQALVQPVFWCLSVMDLVLQFVQHWLICGIGANGLTLGAHGHG